MALVAGGAFGAPAAPSVVAPKVAGFSPERLARIDKKFSRAVEDGKMVGGQGIIARDGRVLFDRVWGNADRERGVPMCGDSLYRIYSMSKPVTAVAVLMLYEEGHFLLQDKIGKFLPELANLQLIEQDENGDLVHHAPKRQPTIRDLLRNTAGMTYGFFGKTVADRRYLEADLFRAPTLADFTRRLGGLPLLYEPGTRWHYSVATDVLGRLVEVISGDRFGEFLRKRIFAPLEMVDTTFVVPEARRDRLTQLYSPIGTRFDWQEPWQFLSEVRLEPADPEWTRPFLDGSHFESGGYGLVSTSRDYLRFALMLAGEGSYKGVRLLSPSTVRLLRANHLKGIDTSNLIGGVDAFGLGFGVVEDPASSRGELGAAGTFGWAGAAGTLFWVDPGNDMVGLFMNQSVPNRTNLGTTFKVMTYQAMLE
jgi:CubicO group peptidase (beta-lactamase class C family)